VVVRVDLFVDPACWWSWLTSRWLVEVAPTRSLQVRWRPYGLLLRDGPEGLEDWKARVWGASLRAVRVMQALDSENPDRVRGFYEAVVTGGVADYNAGRPPFQDLEGALAAAGLASAYAAAADEATRDKEIRRSMIEASAAVGRGSGRQRWCCITIRRLACSDHWSRRRRPGPRRCGCGTPWWPSPPCRGC
jgi:hypothetical protein